MTNLQNPFSVQVELSSELITKLASPLGDGVITLASARWDLAWASSHVLGKNYWIL